MKKLLESIELKVYTSPDLITYSPFTVPISEIHIEDPPLILAFAWLFGMGPWRRLEMDPEPIAGLDPCYKIADRELIFVNCQYHFYRVMVIY